MSIDERYSRQIMLPEIGVEGQSRLFASSALIVGLGGLGCPVALYLTGAGVGRIGLADADTVSESNLQRQTLYGEAQTGMAKTVAANKRLSELSSATIFEQYPEGLTAQNAREIIARYDLVVDCTDNFATRYLIDDVCAELGKPWIFGSIGEFYGTTGVMNHLAGRRFVDLYPDRETFGAMPTASAGVIGATPGVIGAIEAAEAVKLLAGCQPALDGKILTFDLLTMQSEIIKI